MATTDTPGLPAPRAVMWRLHIVMAERGIRSAAELYRRLQPYDIDINLHQLTRIVACLPTRLNIQVLAALMAELQCDAHALLQLGPPREQAKAAPEPQPVKATPKKMKNVASRPPLSVLGPGMSSLVGASRHRSHDE